MWLASDFFGLMAGHHLAAMGLGHPMGLKQGESGEAADLKAKVYKAARDHAATSLGLGDGQVRLLWSS